LDKFTQITQISPQFAQIFPKYDQILPKFTQSILLKDAAVALASPAPTTLVTF